MTTEELNKETGLPLIDAEEAAKGAAGGKKAIIIAPIIITGMGYGITCGIHYWGSTELYEKRLATVHEYELNWAYHSAFMFSVLVLFLNTFPMIFKSKIMRGKSGNLRANMFIYKLAAENQSPSAVVLESEGDIGMYNRGNRALYHFLENSSPMLLGMALNSFVYPFPTMILMIIFVVGRIIYTLGYTMGGYGKHAPGFILDRIAFATTMGTFLFVAFNNPKAV